MLLFMDFSYLRIIYIMLNSRNDKSVTNPTKLDASERLHDSLMFRSERERFGFFYLGRLLYEF
ncbi:hypothetical protein VCRA2114E365_140060 [Vibrio crassostreae]|nr:hypothetical protein VCRA2119O245_110008 [Vibrio crassostreae]CAK1765224.1 hypothetical protein VCRA2113O359_140060 [Vibrio crassostreae]CAK1765471.1 hypothetical protein VCRA2113O363_140060 [Vibrio crassostreae]CAK1765602.1 hypothetical protein VCRA2113O354_140060 [Vibrio crassostreae]CAK1768227.1 hypothetical protein VCRA2114O367_140096 [Vibrio crassostreae]